MRILITGGAGFIGSHIQDAYIKLGHEVAVLDNFSSGRRDNLNAQARCYEADLLTADFDGIFSQFRPEVLSLHAAQINVRKSVEDPIFDCQVNGIGMLRILEAARKHGVKKIIFASSGGAVYGARKDPCSDPHRQTWHLDWPQG